MYVKNEAPMEQSGTDVGSVRAHRITSQAKWTFLVYMAGANNLDGAALSEANKGFNKVEHLKDNIARFHDHEVYCQCGAQSELFAGEITTFKMNYGRQGPPQVVGEAPAYR
jgi:hypothetical protein